MRVDKSPGHMEIERFEIWEWHTDLLQGPHSMCGLLKHPQLLAVASSVRATIENKYMLEEEAMPDASIGVFLGATKVLQNLPSN